MPEAQGRGLRLIDMEWWDKIRIKHYQGIMGYLSPCGSCSTND